MTNLEKAVDKLLEIEGFISDIQDDPGGLTFQGISRHYHPNWEGWKYVDSHEYKKASELVPQFYKENYWDKLHCQNISSFHVAFNLFQISVNRKIKDAVFDMQTACVILGENIEVDGIIGPHTLKAINKLPEVKLVEIFLGLQAKFYINRTLENEKNRSFINGWLRKRVFKRMAEVYES